MAKLTDYFALKPTPELGKALWTKVQDDRNTDSAVSPHRDRNARAMLYYFGQNPTGTAQASMVSRGGDQGELAVYRVNHSRALVQTLINLILSAKVVWECVAGNSDSESRAQTILGAAILEQYWKDYRVASFAARQLEEAVVFGDAFIYAPWDKSLGQQYAPGVFTGDIDFKNVSTWDVIRDPYKKSYDQLDWRIVCLRESRFTLAAKYPQFEERILSVPSDIISKNSNMLPGQAGRDTEDINVYHFYHDRTAATPAGRETIFVADDCVLEDGPLSYDTVPLYRVSAAEMFGTPFGYTAFQEILGLQEIVDSLESSVATNQTTFSTQMIGIQTGSNVSPESIGGIKLITYPLGGSPPIAVQLTKTAPEVFQHIKDMVQNMEQLMGLNSVVRGVANSGEQSGSALALLSNQAKQQSSNLEGNFYQGLRSLGQGILETIRVKCPFPRTVALAGKTNTSLAQIQEYTKKDLTAIHRVNVDIGNPLQQTIAGRKELATMYIQALGPGSVRPEQLEQVIDTGRLEPLTNGLQKQLLLICSENESLQKGDSPPVLADDDHALHMREHVAMSSDPVVRGNPAAMQALNDHMNQHWSEYRAADPARLMVLGQTPPPQLGPPPGAPPAPGGPPPSGPPPGMGAKGPGPKPAMAAKVSGPPTPPSEPPAVQMPTDKSTGQKAPVAGPPIQG